MEVQVLSQKGKHRILQDALAFSSKNNIKMIVCDGHGSSQYCRSNLGAKIATKVCMSIDFTGNIDEYVNEVHQRFLHLIKKHLAFRPLSKLEQELTKDLEDKHYVYGTTLLGILEYHQNYYAFRVGDGYLFYQDKDYQWVSIFKDNSVFSGTPCSLVQDKITVETAKLPEFNSLLISSDGIASLYGSDYVIDALYRCQLNNSFPEFVYNQSHFSHKNDDCSLIYLNWQRYDEAIKQQHQHLLIFNEMIKVVGRIKEIDYLIPQINQNNDYLNKLQEERQLLKDKLKTLMTQSQSFYRWRFFFNWYQG